MSAGAGSKGARDYDWAWISITQPAHETAGHHWLLIRRRINDGELAFYRCWSARAVPLRVLVRVAGTRWSSETCFQTGKTLGLDEPQVHRWHAWHRHVTLIMLAQAILTVIAARERGDRPAADQTVIPLTLPEIRRLFAKPSTNPPPDQPLADLVTLATPTPSTRPDQPLPPSRPTNPSTGIYITNPGCRTRRHGMNTPGPMSGATQLTAIRPESSPQLLVTSNLQPDGSRNSFAPVRKRNIAFGPYIIGDVLQ
ncbi:hypothetical protein ACQEUX_19225 [Micromonospora sp. CA-259024]|uniref:hypothetical protein n=1 Tax=Micromonospora sp. CA-259024 TaxID=3239965 RepID=UPI003D8FC5B0